MFQDLFGNNKLEYVFINNDDNGENIVNDIILKQNI